MPKNKRKGATNRPVPPQMGDAPRTEDDDDMSVMSVDSMGNTSVAESLDMQDMEGGSQVTPENKLIDFIDMCSEKGTATRVKGLEGIRKILQQKMFLFDPDWSHSQTTVDALERSLKRGKGVEQRLAAHNLFLFIIQNDDASLLESDRISELLAQMRVLINDSSTNVSVRCSCITITALLTFMRSQLMVSEIDESMRMMENVFRGSFLKGDGNVAKLSPAVMEVHLAALKAWLLLFVIAHHSQFRRVRDEVLVYLPDILSSPNVDLRITAGEGIALIYERFHELEDEENVQEGDLEYLLNFPKYSQMLELLDELAKDGAKNRAKAERRKQRSSFRDIISSVRDGDSPTAERIRFGSEEMSLNGWCDRRVYDSFCEIVSGGMTNHLKENPSIREIFRLGPPPLVDPGDKSNKGPNRHERHLANQAIAKERYTRRSQHRDKRFVY